MHRFLPMALLCGCIGEPPVVAAPRPLGAAVVEAPVVEAPEVGCASRVEDLALGSDPRLWGEDVVVVRKAARQLLHFERGVRAGSCYRVGLGQGAGADHGTKTRQGDLKTPEGWYRTSDKPTSRYYGAIAIHYPNAEDATAAIASGLLDETGAASVLEALARDAKPPQDTPLGGEILIHGGGSGSDWTLGCVALDDADLDLLRGALPVNQRFDVLVVP